MPEINFEEFRWFVPEPKNAMAITIPSLASINFNSALLEKLLSHITIGVFRDGHQLAICEKENGYKLNKGGRIKDEKLIKCITAAGIRLPAKYVVTMEENGWLALLETQGTPPVSTKKITKTPKNKPLSGLRAELESRT